MTPIIIVSSFFIPRDATRFAGHLFDMGSGFNVQIQINLCRVCVCVFSLVSIKMGAHRPKRDLFVNEKKVPDASRLGRDLHEIIAYFFFCWNNTFICQTNLCVDI